MSDAIFINVTNDISLMWQDVGKFNAICVILNTFYQIVQFEGPHTLRS